MTLDITGRGANSTDPAGLSFGWRFTWVAAAWSLALVVTSQLAFGDPLLVLVLPAFPAGLFFDKRATRPELLIGWTAYAVLSVWLLSTPEPRRYRRLLVLLVAVLLVNVVGCQYAVRHYHFEGIL